MFKKLEVFAGKHIGGEIRSLFCLAKLFLLRYLQ